MRKQSEHVGVVLATYNGKKNLLEQLLSLENQEILPKELVVCDDGSNDSTLEIARDFKEKASFPVIISSTKRNLGPTENFFFAASKSSSTYIAFCDQDDIWLPNKIALCDHAVLNYSPNLILHSYVDFYVDQGGKERIAKTMTLPKLGLVTGVSVNPSIIWPGMSMVVHNKLLRDVKDFQIAWYPYLNKIRDLRPEILYIHWADMHDLFVLNRVRLEGSVFLISEVCAKHRTNDGGFHSDPRGSGLRSVPEIEALWGHSRANPYKLWALFCEDFTHYLDELNRFGDLQRAKEYYARWSKLWSFRAAVHSEKSSFFERAFAFRSILYHRGYQGRWAGGFGPLSSIKDLAAVFGMKIG